MHEVFALSGKRRSTQAPRCGGCAATVSRSSPARSNGSAAGCSWPDSMRANDSSVSIPRCMRSLPAMAARRAPRASGSEVVASAFQVAAAEGMPIEVLMEGVRQHLQSTAQKAAKKGITEFFQDRGLSNIR